MLSVRSHRRARLSVEALERRNLPSGDLCIHMPDSAEINHGVIFAPADFAALADTAPANPASPASVPGYSSLPGAPVTIFLDFDGHYESNWGNYRPGTTPAFDTNGNPNSFSQSELNVIYDTWLRVAEDFAPFNVNVTTIEPSSFANRVGLRVVIGGDGSWLGDQAGGVGYINSFTNSLPNSVYVFSQNLANASKYIADASSHEAGHGFGLDHQSLYSSFGNKLDEYNPGTSAKAPIMGGSYYSARSTWWYGTAGDGPTIYQDDMAMLARSANGFGYRPDDHGSTAGSASFLTRFGNQLSGEGVIGTASDLDFFAFDSGGGPANFQVNVAPSGPNLDVVLELRSSLLSVIASADPSNSLSASISANLAPGRYYLVVRSKGAYGDVGQFSITGTDSGTPPPTVTDSNEILVTGAGQGNPPRVLVYDAGSGELRFDFYAFAPGFLGGVRVATGDVSGDGVPDIVVAAGAGAGPHVKVFDGTNGVEIRSFFAFDPGFDNGLFAASADFDGDGHADIVIGADAGAGPHVRIFSGANGGETASFFAYDSGFRGGVRVAAADINGDGTADVITGAGPGAGPHVKVFDGATRAEIRSYFAFDPGFDSGVFVAAGDLDGDNRAETVVGAGDMAAPHTRIFRGIDNAMISSFFAFSSSLNSGVRVGIVDRYADGQNDLVFGTGAGGSSQVRILNGATLQDLNLFHAYEGSFTGEVNVAGR